MIARVASLVPRFVVIVVPGVLPAARWVYRRIAARRRCLVRGLPPR